MHGRCYHCNTQRAPHRFTEDGRIECLVCGADATTGNRRPKILDELKPRERCDLPLWRLQETAA